MIKKKRKKVRIKKKNLKKIIKMIIIKNIKEIHNQDLDLVQNPNLKTEKSKKKIIKIKKITNLPVIKKNINFLMTKHYSKLIRKNS
jgi:hypothetical protein